MARIHLVGGEKGGVGKSLFCCCLAYYCDQHNIEYHLVDTDPLNPDVGQIYSGITDIHFRATEEMAVINSKQAAKVDQIFEMAITKPVLVNLPANVHDSVSYWILSNGLLENESDWLSETGVDICQWFLTNGSYTSINLFLESLKTYKGKLPHILVRNRGLNQDWESVDQREDFLRAKKEYEFSEILLPALRATERDYIEEHQLPFVLVFEDPAIPVLSRQRLRNFLRLVEEELATTNMINADESRQRVA